MSGYNKGPGPGWGRGPGGMPPHLMGVNNDFGGGGMLQQGLPGMMLFNSLSSVNCSGVQSVCSEVKS